jgi:hypothetical protein
MHSANLPRPDIVEAILGRQPAADSSLERLRKHFRSDWAEQRTRFGFPSGPKSRISIPDSRFPFPLLREPGIRILRRTLCSISGHQVDVRMKNGLSGLAATIHHNIETLRIPRLENDILQIPQKRKTTSIFVRIKIENCRNMSARDDQAVTWRDRILVRNRESMVIANQHRLLVVAELAWFHRFPLHRSL